MGVSVILSDWVSKKYGERGGTAAAKFLGYPVKTVIAWLSLTRFPRLEAQEVIVLKTAGDVSIDDWRTAYLKQQQKTNKATK